MGWTYNPFTDELDNTGSTLNTPASYLGSACLGSDGETSRTLTVTEATTLDKAIIIVDNQTLHPTTDYTVLLNVITFVNAVFDSMRITIWNYT